MCCICKYLPYFQVYTKLCLLSIGILIVAQFLIEILFFMNITNLQLRTSHFKIRPSSISTRGLLGSPLNLPTLLTQVHASLKNQNQHGLDVHEV